MLTGLQPGAQDRLGSLPRRTPYMARLYRLYVHIVQQVLLRVNPQINPRNSV
jgi:hypothetical protein